MVSGGTENHMVLVDLRDFDAELTGKVAQEVLDRAGITTNRNTIPDDPRSAFITSGLRVGTAAETTAGMREGEFEMIAALMARDPSPARRRRGDRRGPPRRGRTLRCVQPLRKLQVVHGQHCRVHRRSGSGSGRHLDRESSRPDDLLENWLHRPAQVSARFTRM